MTVINNTHWRADHLKAMQATEHETIKRYVFAACEQHQHEQCQVWQSGWVDGALRQAGEQCACVCHQRKRGGHVETD